MKQFKIGILRGLIALVTLSLSVSYIHAQADTLLLPESGVSVITGKKDIKLAEKIMGEMAPLQKSATTQELMIIAAKKLLGTPYVAGTLDEGDKERLRIYLTKTDCIIFVETCLNLALAVKQYGQEADFLKFADLVRQSRYRNGVVVNYSDRVHYTTEWIRSLEKRGLAEDATRQSGGVRLSHPINYMSRHPQNYKQLNAPSDLKVIKKAEEDLNATPFYFIPTRSIRSMEDKIESGNIIAYRSAISGLDIAHVALALVEGDDVKFIHASMAEKRVVIDKKTVADYVQGRKNLTGISLVAVK